MKLLPIVVAALAFTLPVGFVLISGLSGGEDTSQPKTGKLLYFYSPG